MWVAIVIHQSKFYLEMSRLAVLGEHESRAHHPHLVRNQRLCFHLFAIGVEQPCFHTRIGEHLKDIYFLRIDQS